MTTTTATKPGTPARMVRGAAARLAFAAAPVFAFMGVAAASDATRAALCSMGPGLPPMDGMATMYLLMSLFHLPPWLKLVSSPRAGSH